MPGNWLEAPARTSVIRSAWAASGPWYLLQRQGGNILDRSGPGKARGRSGVRFGPRIGRKPPVYTPRPGAGMRTRRLRGRRMAAALGAEAVARSCRCPDRAAKPCIYRNRAFDRDGRSVERRQPAGRRPARGGSGGPASPEGSGPRAWRSARVRIPASRAAMPGFLRRRRRPGLDEPWRVACLVPLPNGHISPIYRWV